MHSHTHIYVVCIYKREREEYNRKRKITKGTLTKIVTGIIIVISHLCLVTLFLLTTVEYFITHVFTHSKNGFDKHLHF